MIPYFAGALPPGDYGLRIVEDFGGSPANVDLTITIPEDCYWIPYSSAPTYGQSIWRLIALLATANSVKTWAYAVITPTVDQDRGLATGLQASGGTIKIDYTNTVAAADGKLPLEWLGWDSADDPDSGAGTSIATDYQPKYTWFPQAHFHQMAHDVEPVQMHSSGATADGSEHTTVYDDDVLRYWGTFKTADGDGTHRARIDVQSLKSTIENWGTHDGMALSAADRKTWTALNGTDGWWHRTRAARANFLYVSDQSDVLNSQQGIYRISYADAAPMSMDDWKGLRKLTHTARVGGRAAVEFCARLVEGPA